MLFQRRKFLVTPPAAPDHYWSALPAFQQLYGPISSVKDEYRYFGFRYLPRLQALELPILELNLPLEAVFIDFRILPNIEFVIRNCILKLGSSWSQTIVCGKANGSFIQEMVRRLDRNIRVIQLDYENITIAQYNHILTDMDFWKQLTGERILIYQEDTCIFRTNIDSFIGTSDYIGAPYLLNEDQSKNNVGNGGLSLRTKEIMLQVLQTNPYLNTVSDPNSFYKKGTLQYMARNNMAYPPEDMYFVLSMEKFQIGKVASWNEAYAFSSESIVNTESFGAHGVWLNGYTSKHQPNDPQLWKKMLYTYVIPYVRLVEASGLIMHRGGWNAVKDCIRNNLTCTIDANQITLVDTCEDIFLWDLTNKAETLFAGNKPWIGILHLTPLTEKFSNCQQQVPPFLEITNLEKLFDSDKCTFLQHLSSCLGLIVMSTYIGDYVIRELQKHNIDHVPVKILMHPVVTENVPLFSMMKFQRNRFKQLIMIGNQLRRISSFYLVNSLSLNKLWLTGTRHFLKCFYFRKCEFDYFNITLTQDQIDAVEMRYISSFDEYDELLTKNIVFLDLFDAGCNNTILECIVRNTPIIVRRMEGVEEYLGKEYPLYFNELEEVPQLLQIHRLNTAYLYLQNMDKHKFYMSYFNHTFLQTIHEFNANRKMNPENTIHAESDWNT